MQPENLCLDITLQGVQKKQANQKTKDNKRLPQLLVLTKKYKKS